MARPLRIEYEGAYYHITARGNEKRKIYFTKSDYEKFKGYLAEAKKKYGIIIHSYVLMSNHYHLIIQTPEANLSKAMHYINGSYTTYTNIKRNRSGHLFQGRYKAILIDRDNYLLELSRYLHLNPVRAGMINRPEEYPYSSYKTYISGSKEDILSEDVILRMLSNKEGDAKKKYKEFVESAIGRELENPLKTVYGGLILGGNKFIKETLKRIKENNWQREEISHRRELKAAHGIEDILQAVCEHYRVSKEEVLKDKKSELKKATIYLTKRYTGITNKQIGELFGGISYSGISKVYQRFAKQLEGEKTLKKKVSEIEMRLSSVKG